MSGLMSEKEYGKKPHDQKNKVFFQLHHPKNQRQNMFVLMFVVAAIRQEKKSGCLFFFFLFKWVNNKAQN
jgi:hypothetical protein